MGRGKGMSGVRAVPVNKKSSKEDQESMGNIAEKLMDPSKFDNDVALKKYHTIYVKSGRAIELLGDIAKMLGNPRDMIVAIVRMTEQLNKHSDITENNIKERFNEFREMATIKILIGVSSRFQQLEIDFDDEDWYPDIAGGYTPFQFSDINIASIYEGRENASVNKVLFELAKVTHKIYVAYTSPNINTDNFAKAINTVLLEMKKIPELSRYHGSFRVIADCGDMLKDNFGGYYKKFVKTKNSVDIFTTYISDISEHKAGGLDTQTKLGFSKIIRYLTKNSNAMNAVDNPQAKKYFDNLDDILEVFEEDIVENDDEGELSEESKVRIERARQKFGDMDMLNEQLGRK